MESRAGCHCASLAHRALDLEPAGSCRLSFYLYNTLDEVDYAADILAAIVAGCGKRKRRSGGLQARGLRALPVPRAGARMNRNDRFRA